MFVRYQSIPSSISKAGIFSIRVFGHEGKAHAPLKEMCRFSLRAERSEKYQKGGENLHFRPNEIRNAFGS